MNTKKNPQNKSLPAQFVIRFGKWGWTTVWHQMMKQLAPRNPQGEYIRPPSEFRNFIGSAAENPYQPASGRYRLYVGMGCPWAHRTLVVRALKGLESAIAVSMVIPSGESGIWVFPEAEKDCQTLPELYRLAKPNYRGRSTVPVLWDEQNQAIVNNESAEIIVMLNACFNEWADRPDLDLYPASLKEKIDQWNEKIYHTVNNGVYRCGFAQTQAAYEQACREVFAAFDEIDQVLERDRYLCGEQITLADVRLFTTLFRFDSVYYSLFKCNLRRVQDYAHLGNYLRDFYQLPGVAETCDLEQVKRDYYGNLFPLNPGGIIPLGPDLSGFLGPNQPNA
ncbi:MAG: glutathione S-transferase family protein [Snowella sp.]|nr:glutathione S-transferase family protein [Snowella sp.]